MITRVFLWLCARHNASLWEPFSFHFLDLHLHFRKNKSPLKRSIIEAQFDSIFTEIYRFRIWNWKSPTKFLFNWLRYIKTTLLIMKRKTAILNESQRIVVWDKSIHDISCYQTWKKLRFRHSTKPEELKQVICTNKATGTNKSYLRTHPDLFT